MLDGDKMEITRQHRRPRQLYSISKLRIETSWESLSNLSRLSLFCSGVRLT